MRLELIGKHLRVTAPMRRIVEAGVTKLDRVLNNGAVSLQVVFQEVKGRLHAEMTLHARGEHFFHARGSAREWDLAVSQAFEKLEQQARRLKGKWTEGRRRAVSPAKAAAAAPRPERARRLVAEETPLDGRESQVRIIRVRRAAPKPMTVDEAALEIGDHAGDVYVFRNALTDSVNVLFRRPDGNLGLVEPES